MSKKNQLVIIILLVCLSIFGGGSLAYFNSRHSNSHILSSDIYQTKVTDTFTSPNDFLPGTIVNRNIKLRNRGNVKVAVRAKIEESWTSANGDELPLYQLSDFQYTEGNRGYVVEYSCNQVVYYNNANNSDRNMMYFDTLEEVEEFKDNACDEYDYNGFWDDNWVEYDGYYYYRFFVDPNKETASFINSLTFNENITNDISCTANNGVYTCTSTGDGYDGATYTLSVTFETIQYDVYKDVWDEFIDINNEPFNVKGNTSETISVWNNGESPLLNSLVVTNNTDRPMALKATIDGYFTNQNNVKVQFDHWLDYEYSDYFNGDCYTLVLWPGQSTDSLINKVVMYDSYGFNYESLVYHLNVSYVLIDFLNANDYYDGLSNQSYDDEILFGNYENQVDNDMALRGKYNVRWLDKTSGSEVDAPFNIYVFYNQNNNLHLLNEDEMFYWYSSVCKSSNNYHSVSDMLKLFYDTSNTLLSSDLDVSGNIYTYSYEFTNVILEIDLELETTPYSSYATDWNIDESIGSCGVLSLLQ